jgi:hypothetical protein
MELLFFWFAIGVLCAVIAPTRGRSAFAWFLLGFLLSPLALIALLALPNLKEPPALPTHASPTPKTRPVNDLRACPYCAEDIKKAAKVCKHCGRDIEPEPLSAHPDLEARAALRQAAGITSTKDCPECGKAAPNWARLCRHCGYNYNTGQKVEGSSNIQKD